MNQQECTEPGVVTPEDLLAYLDGDAPRHVVEHVAHCPHCAALARSYRETASGLQQILYRVDCPSSQTLGEYELNLVSPSERQQIAAHVLTCDRCADDLRTLRVFMAGGLVPVPPVTLSDRARRFVANLVPPVINPAYAGLRGTAEDAARVYQSGDVTLALEWRPSAQSGLFALVGLAMREADSGTLENPEVSERTVRLTSDAGAVLVERTDDLGNFQFDKLSPGAYQLEIDLDDAMIVVEDLRVSR